MKRLVLIVEAGNSELPALVRFAWPRLEVPEPAALIDEPTSPPFRLFLPWALAGLASLLVVLAIDHRGIELNLVEARLQPGKLVSRRDDVKELRARVRRGDAPIEDYKSLLRGLTSSDR